MQTRNLLLCLGIALAPHVTYAQGTFQNLDFEQAQIIINGSPALIATSNAFPGWTVLANGVPLDEVQRDGVFWNGVGIGDAGNGYALQGNYSVLLAGWGLHPLPLAIAQSGFVPAGSESVTFLATGRLQVSFAGNPIMLHLVGETPYYDLYGADISAYAGQYCQLLFQTDPSGNRGINILDDIVFSPQSIPEPSRFGLLSMGVLVWMGRSRWRRWQRAANGKSG